MSGMAATGGGLAPVIPLRPAMAGQRHRVAGARPLGSERHPAGRQLTYDVGRAQTGIDADSRSTNTGLTDLGLTDAGATRSDAEVRRLPRPAARGVRSRQPARLTRRGRLVVMIGLLLLGVLAGSVSARALAAPAEPAGAQPRSVVVRQGESLWSIATHYAPDRGPGSVVDEIRKLNQLPGMTVYPGQWLRLPPA